MKLSDRLGIIVSIGCLIHCLALPVILPALPLLGFIGKHDGVFHLVLASAIVLVACVALIPGYRKHHNSEPLGLASMAAAVLILTGIVENMIGQNLQMTLSTCAGSLAMVGAHYRNHKLLCACKHHEGHHVS